MLGHERQTVAMDLAVALHHTCGVRPDVAHKAPKGTEDCELCWWAPRRACGAGGAGEGRGSSVPGWWCVPVFAGLGKQGGRGSGLLLPLVPHGCCVGGQKEGGGGGGGGGGGARGEAPGDAAASCRCDGSGAALAGEEQEEEEEEEEEAEASQGLLSSILPLGSTAGTCTCVSLRGSSGAEVDAVGFLGTRAVGVMSTETWSP